MVVGGLATLSSFIYTAHRTLPSPQQHSASQLEHNLPIITRLLIPTLIHPPPRLFHHPRCNFNLVAALILKRLEYLSGARTEDGREEVATCDEQRLEALVNSRVRRSRRGGIGMRTTRMCGRAIVRIIAMVQEWHDSEICTNARCKAPRDHTRLY